MAYTDADFELDPAAAWFVQEVAKVSHDALVVQPAYNCCGRSYDTSQDLIRGVAKGRWDLGWTQTRDIAEAGAPGVAALTAPLLIDTYATEKAVLASAVPKAVLPGFQKVGVRGIAIEPGTLRRPIGSGKALLAPADWKDTTFWTTRSSTSAATITALGATVPKVGLDDRDGGFDDGSITGVENSVAWQVASNHVPSAVMRIDQALWPRTDALFAAPHLRLTAQEERWLQQAAADVTARTDDIAAFDTAQVTPACAAGYRFASATPAQRSATEHAVAPVVEQIETDPVARAAIESITAMKPAEPPAEYDVPADCVAR